MTRLKRDEVVVLIGAGASVEAGIPHSAQMVERIEDLITTNKEWQKFHDLYWFVRSAIFFAQGMKGRIGPQVSYNIERLVTNLEELAKRDEHTLFPFIGSWNPKLLEVAGSQFEKIDEFRRKIIDILRREWLAVDRYDRAKYYEGLIEFQSEFQHPLRIFSLNYDLCIERVCLEKLGRYPQRGFDDRTWDWRVFDADESSEIFLYKLHGSYDWKYVRNDRTVTFVDDPAAIRADETALIFGTTLKLQYEDPFLFMAYEFRRWTLNSKIIVCIGYGFGDPHINAILGQALNNNENRLLLSAAPLMGKSSEEQQSYIADVLELNRKSNGQVICWDMRASDFFRKRFRVADIAALLPDEPSLFVEISLTGENHGQVRDIDNASSVLERTVVVGEVDGVEHDAEATFINDGAEINTGEVLLEGEEPMSSGATS